MHLSQSQGVGISHVPRQPTAWQPNPMLYKSPCPPPPPQVERCGHQRPGAEARAPAPQHECRKRKRASPWTGSAFSEHIAQPSTPTQELLPLIRGELRHHQLAGVHWLMSLYCGGLNCVLSDELDVDRKVRDEVEGGGQVGVWMAVLVGVCCTPSISAASRWAQCTHSYYTLAWTRVLYPHVFFVVAGTAHDQVDHRPYTFGSLQPWSLKP